MLRKNNWCNVEDKAYDAPIFAPIFAPLGLDLIYVFQLWPFFVRLRTLEYQE